MSLTIQQSDEEILSNFYAMEEGQAYVLNRLWFSELNRLRKEKGWPHIHDKYQYVRVGQKLFVNGSAVFDFTNEFNLAFNFAIGFSVVATFAFILQNNGFEKFVNSVPETDPIVDCFPQSDAF